MGIGEVDLGQGSSGAGSNHYLFCAVRAGTTGFFLGVYVTIDQ